VPYKREGSTILKQEKDGAWHVKDTCKDADTAKRQLRLLLAVEHGWVKGEKK
jgi:hypothetical protein